MLYIYVGVHYEVEEAMSALPSVTFYLTKQFAGTL